MYLPAKLLNKEDKQYIEDMCKLAESIEDKAEKQKIMLDVLDFIGQKNPMFKNLLLKFVK